MNVNDEELTRLAEEELLKEARRAAARAEIIGPEGWRKCPSRNVNKRFLVSTIRDAVYTNKRVKFNHKNVYYRESYHSDASNKSSTSSTLTKQPKHITNNKNINIVSGTTTPSPPSQHEHERERQTSTSPTNMRMNNTNDNDENYSHQLNKHLIDVSDTIQTKSNYIDNDDDIDDNDNDNINSTSRTSKSIIRSTTTRTRTRSRPRRERQGNETRNKTINKNKSNKCNGTSNGNKRRRNKDDKT